MDKMESYSYIPEQFIESYQAFRKNLQLNPSSNPSPTTLKRHGGPCDNGEKKMIIAAVQIETTPPSKITTTTRTSDSTTSAPSHDAQEFYDRAIRAVEDAVETHGATLVLLQELFLGPYFCQSQNASLFALAEDDIDFIGDGADDNGDGDGDERRRQQRQNGIISNMQALAKRLQIVLPVSIFEKKNNTFYNSVVMIDADGSNLGTYRKSHIPDGTGYQEKFYFSPGDTGFKVFRTAVGNVGVGICWDQWFPEAARSMALMGADVLLYPTAIGSEPQDPTLDSSDHWHRVMQGHAAANMVPVVASNRYGTEILMDEKHCVQQQIRFYGRSFITDETGAIVKEAKDGSDIISYTVDVERNRATRAAWGLFRDRRPELYGVLRTKDGSLPMP